MSMDLLVFGPHPDDIEIGLGGTIARHAAEGRAVGLCDLTAGELGSNGTSAERLQEAAAAARVLGVASRENLGWPDGGILDTPDLVRDAVNVIRRHQPRTIALPYWDDRHPDHVAASRVLTIAAFRSGLRRFDTGRAPWRADRVVYYFINDSAPASFVIDVSAHYDRKREALDCHASQFAPAAPDAVATRLTAASFRQLIESRDAQFGARAGVRYAEGLIVRDPVVLTSLVKDVR
jgi:bacillithiol biosynthesis deacetylase BshB1